VWGTALRELQALYPLHACKEFLRALPLLGFAPDRVPQLQAVSEVLESTTGWRIRPVAGVPAAEPASVCAGGEGSVSVWVSVCV
jgi:phenylalanine-4-hydroxylase